MQDINKAQKIFKKYMTEANESSLSLTHLQSIYFLVSIIKKFKDKNYYSKENGRRKKIL